MLFLLLKALLFGCISDLLGALSIDVIDLVGSKALEVIGDVPAFSKLVNCGVSVLRHDVTVIRNRDLKLVLGLLILLPGVLSVPLLLRQSFVLCLDFLHISRSFLCCFVFKHASHPGNIVGLLSICLLFKALLFFKFLMLACLYKFCRLFH